jgi:hypothetical protein
MKKTIVMTLWVFTLMAGIAFGAGDSILINPVVAPAKLITQKTINISAPVKSYNELFAVISDSLNSVCENLNLTIKNTNQWFSKKQFDKCIDQADPQSMFIGPYYKGYNYTYTTGGKIIEMNIHFNYQFPRKILLRYLSETEIKATNIINTVITPDMEDYQKEIALHNYIVNHTRYDDLNYRNNTVPDESYTPYGILVRNTGVCAGYAHTIKLLLNKVGIECLLVSGKADGGDHAWNIVKIDNEYYHLDTTWDDPVGKEQLTYHYFNLSDEMIAVNHTWDKSRYPLCSATKYNYYRMNDLWVKDMGECEQRIQNAVANREESIQLKVSGFNLTAFKKTMKSLLKKMSFVGQYTYSYDQDLGIVEIQFQYSK